MQTLPLVIWGLRPAEGTSEQPLQAEAGFAGILEQAAPADGTDAVSILGEERLEAGSNGPTALDQELDQAETSVAASDLMSLVMSFVQTGQTANQPNSAPIEFAAVTFPAETTAVKTEGKLPVEFQVSQAIPEAAASDSSLAGEVLPITESPAPQVSSKTALPEAPKMASPEPASLSNEAAPNLLSKKTVRKQEGTPRIQASLQEPTEALTPSPEASEEAKSESPASFDAVFSLESERPVEVRSSKKQTVQVAQKPITGEETQTPVMTKGLDRTSAKPQVAPVSFSASTKIEESAPKQTNVVAKTSSPITELQQPVEQTELSVQDHSLAFEVKESTQPLLEDAPVQTEAPAAKKSSAKVRINEGASMARSAQDSESKSPAVRSRVDVPSFAHQSDPVSQMLTDRWVAWVKQNFAGQDAPKTSVQSPVILPTTPNQAFNVSIQDGQVHMDLPKPVTEVFLSPAAAAFVKTTVAVINEQSEAQVQEDSASNQIPASAPSHQSPLQAVPSKVLRSMVMEPESDAEVTPEVESDEASEASDGSAEFKAEPSKPSPRPIQTAEGKDVEKASAPVSHKEHNPDQASVQVKPEPTLDKTVDEVDGISLKASESESMKGAEAADEPIALESGQQPVEPAGVLQTPQPVQVKTSDRPLTPERAEAAVGQAKEALASQVHQPRGQQTIVRLSPDDLGSLTITVKQRGRRVEAEISASLETVRQVLDSQKQELYQAVESKGSQLSHLTIKSEAAPNTSQDSHMSQQGHQRNGESQREAHQEASRFSRLTAAHTTVSDSSTASTQLRRARQLARFDLTA